MWHKGGKMNPSFREKSLWLMFFGNAAAYSFYFIQVFRGQDFSRAWGPGSGMNVTPSQFVLFGLAVGLLVVMSIVGHIGIAIVDRRPETDERDKLIGLKGTRNGGYVLATGVFFALCIALMTKGNFLFTHVLLGFWVIAQLTEIGSQLFFYRRGA
jgi:uncharacterized BrkB/YihY/UPF0761 family membrane protein